MRSSAFDELAMFQQVEKACVFLRRSGITRHAIGSCYLRAVFLARIDSQRDKSVNNAGRLAKICGKVFVGFCRLYPGER